VRASLAYLMASVICALSNGNDDLLTLAGLLLVLTIPYEVYSVWRVRRALRLSWFWYAAAFPWLGLLVAAFLDTKVSRMLKSSGVKVGLLGPRIRDLPADLPRTSF
jgi:hypothetical protein